MGYRRDLWEIATSHHGVVTIADADEAGIPAVEVRKLAARGALRRYGNGVYVHHDVPTDAATESAIAVALAGDKAFLHREAVLDLLGIGQFNPHRIKVGTRRRVRRTLPEWMQLETRRDVPDNDLTMTEGIPSTTVRRALDDLHGRMPPERWTTLVDAALDRDLIDDRDVTQMPSTGALP